VPSCSNPALVIVIVNENDAGELPLRKLLVGRYQRQRTVNATVVTTRRVYYVIDSGLLAELERRSDLDAIREGVDDMQAGRSVPIDRAKTSDRAVLVERFSQ